MKKLNRFWVYADLHRKYILSQLLNVALIALLLVVVPIPIWIPTWVVVTTPFVLVVLLVGQIFWLANQKPGS